MLAHALDVQRVLAGTLAQQGLLSATGVALDIMEVHPRLVVLALGAVLAALLVLLATQTLSQVLLLAMRAQQGTLELCPVHVTQARVQDALRVSFAHPVSISQALHAVLA